MLTGDEDRQAVKRPRFGERLHEAARSGGPDASAAGRQARHDRNAPTRYWERQPGRPAPGAAPAAGRRRRRHRRCTARPDGQSKQRVSGPAGKMRQLFEAASKLPRRQQQKIIDVRRAVHAASTSATAADFSFSRASGLPFRGAQRRVSRSPRAPKNFPLPKPRARGRRGAVARQRHAPFPRARGSPKARTNCRQVKASEPFATLDCSPASECAKRYAARHGSQSAYKARPRRPIAIAAVEVFPPASPFQTRHSRSRLFL